MSWLRVRELVRKEFIQLFRDKKNRPLLVGAPLLQLFVFGYVVSTGLLFAYGVLSVVLIPVLVFQARFTASPIDVVGIVVLLIMAAICFVPFAFFVRGARSDRNSSPV